MKFVVFGQQFLLPGVADYQEILTSYGKKKIISIEYPSPFLKNQPAEIEIKNKRIIYFRKGNSYTIKLGRHQLKL